MGSPPFILASASPRRRELLGQLGYTPDQIIPADINETSRKGERPRALCARLAYEKARHVHASNPKAVVLGSDTVVALGRRELGKPENASEAERFLDLLSGRAHHVYTAICVIDGQGVARERCVDSRVWIKRLSAPEIAFYVGTGEWQGKAGGYAIQGHAARFVRSIHGSYTGIVGLPLFEAAALLSAAGVAVDSANI